MSAWIRLPHVEEGGGILPKGDGKVGCGSKEDRGDASNGGGGRDHVTTDNWKWDAVRSVRGGQTESLANPAPANLPSLQAVYSGMLLQSARLGSEHSQVAPVSARMMAWTNARQLDLTSLIANSHFDQL